jgi:hypothetical protein
MMLINNHVKFYIKEKNNFKTATKLIKLLILKKVLTYFVHHVTQVMWSLIGSHVICVRWLNPKQIPVLKKLQETGKWQV